MTVNIDVVESSHFVSVYGTITTYYNKLYIRINCLCIFCSCIFSTSTAITNPLAKRVDYGTTPFIWGRDVQQ